MRRWTVAGLPATRRIELDGLQGRTKRSGWSGHGRTNNRAGNFLYYFLLFVLVFFCPDLAGIIIEPVILFDILLETEKTQ